MSEDEGREAVARAQAVTNVYRDRARSVAAVLATVAGALVVALLGATTLEGHMPARIIGVVAAVLLLIASGLLLLASLAGATLRSTGSWFAFWTVKVDQQDQDGADTTREVRLLIRRFSDWAMVVAGSGAVALVVALFVLVLAPEDRSAVIVTFRSTPPATSACGALPSSLVGTVSTSGLEGDASYMLLRLDPGSCSRARGSVELLVNKSEVTVAKER